MKILVCGSTRIRNAEKLIELLDELHEQSAITCLVNGGARGADLLASQWAHSKSITVKKFKIDSAPTKDAFNSPLKPMPARNAAMLITTNESSWIDEELTMKPLYC